MIRILLILTFLISCQKNPPPAEEYVLIEFASKLEEENERINKVYE